MVRRAGVARVFLSYAGDDLAWAHEVFGWLTADGHDVFFDRHERQGIPPGRVWKRWLYDELSRVDALVSLVTVAYRDSAWCLTEVSIADARGCPIIPLRDVDDVEFPLIDELQHASPDPRKMRVQALAALRGLDGNAGWREGDNPYPGLAPFNADMSGLFFGRATETRELAAVVRATAPAKVVAVTGASGSGKSSLLRAGLVPYLSREWVVVGPFVPADAPSYALSKALVAAARRVRLDWSLDEVERRLAQADGLRRAADELLLAAPVAQRVLLAVDQGEDLFSDVVSDEQRGRFAALLGAASGGAVRVVVTVRSEYDAELGLLGRIVPFRVGQLDRASLRTAIEEPARIAGLRLPPGLADQLVEDTGSGDALPLLAFALHKLADGVPRGGVLSAEDYAASGLRAILAEHADAAMAAACAASGLGEDDVMAALVRGMVSEDATGRHARRRLARDSLSPALRVALDQFVDCRLVVSDGPYLRLVHDALIVEWPALAAAVETRGTALRAVVLVDQAAADWAGADHADGYLWDARRYHAITDDLGGPRHADWHVELDDAGRAFLAASRAAITQATRRRRRRLMGTFTGLSVLLVVSMVATVIAVVQARSAQQERAAAQVERDTALVRQLVARADAVRVTDTPLALRLGLAAESIQPVPPAAASLLRTLILNNYAAGIPAHGQPVFVTRFNPAGTMLASGDAYSNKILLHDVRDLRHPVLIRPELAVHTHWVSGIDFTPDGATMVSSSTHETILWDVTAPEELHVLAILQAPEQYDVDAVGVAVSPDGRLLATMHGKVLALYDISDPAHPVVVNPKVADILDYGDVAFSADGRYLAAGTNEGSYRLDNTVRGRARVWRVTDPADPVEVANLPVPAGDVTGVDFAPTGHRFALTSGGLFADDGVLALYDVDDTGAIPVGPVVTDHVGGAWDVAFSPTGPNLATTGLDGTVRTYYVDETAVPVGDPLAYHTDYVYAVAYGPEGQLATGDADGNVILWDRRNPYQPVPGPALTVPEAVTELAVDATGHTLAAGTAGGRVFAWDLTDPLVPRGPGESAPSGAAVTALAFRPHSTVVVAAAGAQTFHDLADVLRPRELATRPAPQDAAAVAFWFSRDGSRMRVVDAHNSVSEWDTSVPAEPRVTATGLAGRSDKITHAAVRPDGRLFASKGLLGPFGALRDISDLDDVRLLEGELQDYTKGPITFSADGRVLATGDENVLLWDVTRPSAPRRLGIPFGGANTELAISPDGALLAVAGHEGRLSVWSIADPGAPFLVSTMRHDADLSAITWFPGGTALASADSTGGIRLWDTRTLTETYADRHDAACRRVGQGLGEREWERFVGGSPAYRRTCR